MTYQSAALSDDLSNLPKLPPWVTSGRAETFEDVAFRSGATLMVLDALVSDPTHGIPVKLLANKLALTAATATSKLEGRLTREADIRDAFHLTPPGEARGPDGDLLAFWRNSGRLKPMDRDWQALLRHAIEPAFEDEIDIWIDAASAYAAIHGPLAGCSFVIRSVLEVDDRAERIACLLSDILLARTLNWKTAFPLTARRLTKPMLRDLVSKGQGADIKVRVSLLTAIEDTIRLSRGLASRSAALRAVAPKLRAKGSAAAIDLFLSLYPN